MKKYKSFPIAISSLLLFGCVNNPSSTSTSTSNNSGFEVSSTSQTTNSSSSCTLITPDLVKEKLKASIDAANKKEAVELLSTNFTVDLDSSSTRTHTYYTPENEIDTTQGNNGKITKNATLTTKVNQGTFSAAADHLQGETKNDFLASLRVSSDYEVDYKSFDSSVNKTYSGDKATFSCYVEESAMYIDFDDEVVRSSIIDYLNDFGGMNLNPLMVPKYIKMENVLSSSTPWPLSVIDSQMVDDDLTDLFDDYDSLPSSAKSAISFTQDEENCHINININKVILATLPLLYQSIATNKLDPESDTYEEEKQKIKNNVTKMNAIINKTTVNALKCDFAFNDNGYSYIAYEIDLVVQDYTFETGTTMNSDNSYRKEEITIDQLSWKTSGVGNLLYNDEVTLLRHPDNPYASFDMEQLLNPSK